MHTIFSEKLLGLPFWFWQFVVFPVTISAFLLLVNVARDKWKAYKNFKLLKEYCVIWLEQIIANGKFRLSYYSEMAKALQEYDDDDLIHHKYPINCEKILNLKVEDLLSLFIKKVEFKDTDEKYFYKSESGNYVALIENLQGVLLLEQMADDKIKNCLALVEKYQSVLENEYKTLIQKMDFHKGDLQKADASIVTDEYFEFVDDIFSASAIEKNESWKNKEIIAKVIDPLIETSREYLNLNPFDQHLLPIIQTGLEYKRVHKIFYDTLKFDSGIFKDFFNQLNDKIDYIEKYLERYKQSKTKSWLDF